MAIAKPEKPLRREVVVKRVAHVVTIDPLGMKIVVKGRRRGAELAWEDLTNGEAALATALNASLGETAVEGLRIAQAGRPPTRQEVIDRNARAQVQLIDALLDLSRILACSDPSVRAVRSARPARRLPFVQIAAQVRVCNASTTFD
jgi:hypothetical protein